MASVTDFSDATSEPWSGASPESDVPKTSEETVTDLTRFIMHVINTRDYDNASFRHLMSPNFRGNVEGYSAAGVENHLNFHRIVCSTSPNYSLEIMDCMAEVDEQRGRAKVWVTTKVTHLRGEVERSSVHLFTWKRLGGEWTCHRHKGLRGIQEFE